MRRLTIALCSISLLAGPLRAGDANTTLESMTVTVQPEPVKTVETIYRAYLTVGSDKFAFLVPEKFRTVGDPAKGKLQLTSLAGDSLITVSFFAPGATDSDVPARERFRELLTSRYSGGKIVAEFTRPALGQDGLGYDVEWKGAGGFTQKTRAVYIPSIAGMLEVTMTTGTKNFTALQASLNQLLGSFVQSADGKLKVHHIASVG